MLRRKNARHLRVLEARQAEEIALDRARFGAPISPDASAKAPQQSSPSPGTESSNPARSSHANLSIEGKPAFREAFQRRRCLVPG